MGDKAESRFNFSSDLRQPVVPSLWFTFGQATRDWACSPLEPAEKIDSAPPIAPPSGETVPWGVQAGTNDARAWA